MCAALNDPEQTLKDVATCAELREQVIKQRSELSQQGLYHSKLLHADLSYLFLATLMFYFLCCSCVV